MHSWIRYSNTEGSVECFGPVPSPKGGDIRNPREAKLSQAYYSIRNEDKTQERIKMRIRSQRYFFELFHNVFE